MERQIMRQTMRLSRLEDVEALYAAQGGLAYGEDVTQIEHALQSAHLAELAGAEDSLVVAALLHDVGHLLQAEAEVAQAIADDRHELGGARALSGLFGPAVREPIALHVAAKRYLCFQDTDYLRGLSAASKRSLELQGGPFDAAQAAAFEGRRHWREAVALRRFDDGGKCETPSGRRLSDYAALMRSVSLAGV
jgi:phosphonate degradation associated HDIG domain protein